MRIHTPVVSLSPVGLLLLLACAPGPMSNDGGAPGDGGAQAAGDEGSLTATISGSPNGHSSLSVTTVPEAFAKWRDTPNGERLSIHANADPGVSDSFGQGSQSLRIYLMPYDGERTYTFSAADDVGGAYAEQDDTHEFFAQYGMPEHGSGSIVITSRTESRLVGTFSFVAENDERTASVELDGQFDLPLVADGG